MREERPPPRPVAPEHVQVVRSRRRRRTSSARVVDGRLVLRLPAALTPEGERAAVTDLLARLHERAAAPLPRTSLAESVEPRPTRGPRGPRGDLGLVERADAVADRWLPGTHAARVAWSHRMSTRWASCTVATAHVRLSARLADAPDAVLDNVLLHELAHLHEPGHGPAFRALLARDPASRDVEAWLRRRSQLELRRALAAATG